MCQIPDWGFRWVVKIRHSWWRIRRSPPFVCHPLSQSHDFCMTRLCIWTPRTLPFVPAHPVGSRRASSSTETPFTGSVCSPALLRTVRSAEHVPFLQLSGKNCFCAAATGITTHEDTRSTSAPWSFVCAFYAEVWVRMMPRRWNVPAIVSRSL